MHHSHVKLDPLEDWSHRSELRPGLHEISVCFSKHEASLKHLVEPSAERVWTMMPACERKKFLPKDCTIWVLQQCTRALLWPVRRLDFWANNTFRADPRGTANGSASDLIEATQKTYAKVHHASENNYLSQNTWKMRCQSAETTSMPQQMPCSYFHYQTTLLAEWY